MPTIVEEIQACCERIHTAVKEARQILVEMTEQREQFLHEYAELEAKLPRMSLKSK